MKKSVKIFDNETGLETGAELVAQHIEKISKAIDKIDKSKASRKLIVALIQDDIKIGKHSIEAVLDSLDSLATWYLKVRK